MLHAEQLSPSKMTERTYKKGEKLLVNTSARSSGEAPPFSRDFPSDLDDAAAEKMCYNKTRVFDPSANEGQGPHVRNYKTRADAPGALLYDRARKKALQLEFKRVAPKPGGRQPFQAGGSYGTSMWAGGNGLRGAYWGAWTWTGTVSLRPRRWRSLRREARGARGVLPLR